MEPNHQSLKSRLQNGELLYGMALLSYSPIVAKVAATAGYDFVIIDMEHGYGNTADTLPCIHSLSAGNTPVIVRVPENTQVWVKKVLDIGPQGIIFPFTNTPEQAQKAVAHCRSALRGPSSSLAKPTKFGMFDEFSNRYDKDLLIMCQIETEEAVRNVGKIAGVEGVDAVMLGPSDLSASVGCLSNPSAERVRELMTTIETTVLGYKRKEGGGPFLAGFAIGPDGPNQFRLRGYQCIRGISDVSAFREACVNDVKKFKQSLDTPISHFHNFPTRL